MNPVPVHISSRRGDPRGTSYKGYSIALAAGGVDIASDVNGYLPADGTFQTSTVSYLALPGDSSLGQQLSITLGSTTLGGQETDFDNVRLTAASIPEPSSVTLLGLLTTAAFIAGRRKG